MMLAANLELTKWVHQESSQNQSSNQDLLEVNTIQNLNQNHQSISHNNLVELVEPDLNFIFLWQILTIVKMIGTEKADKCLNFHTFPKDAHHQKFIKEKKQTHLMIKSHSKEDQVHQQTYCKLKCINKDTKNLNKSIKKKLKQPRLNWTSAFNWRIIKTTTN